MSTPAGTQESDLIAIARVLKTQGRRGEVAAEILTDFPERFAERKQVWLSGKGEVELEEHWFHKNHVILKFCGVDDISAAEALIGSLVLIRPEQRAVLDEGAHYVSDLIGCVVTDAGREIGSVSDVVFGAGEVQLLAVRPAEAKDDLLVPFARAYIEQVDLASRRIYMRLPQGLLDVDAPSKRETSGR